MLPPIHFSRSTSFRFSVFWLLTPCRVLSSHACLCGIKLLVVFVILLVPTFYCIPSVPFYCVFLFHYFIVNSICKPYSSQGTINIELNRTQSFTEDWKVGVYCLITGNMNEWVRTLMGKVKALDRVVFPALNHSTWSGKNWKKSDKKSLKCSQNENDRV